MLQYPLMPTAEEAVSELAGVFRLIEEEYRESGRDLPLDTTVRMIVGTTMLAMLGIGTWAGEEDKPDTPGALVTLTRAVLTR